VGVSADGAVVVGGSYNTQNNYEAYRWTQSTGMVALGYLRGGTGPGVSTFSNAFAANANGSVIVGQSSNAANELEAFRWTTQTGMQPVRAMLTLAGVDLTGWQLNLATAVSLDGTTIAGSGVNPSGQTEAWIVRIPVSAFAFLDLAGTNRSLD